MPRALIDTTVLFAAAYTRDSSHDAALPVLRGIDDGTLPEAVVLDYVLAETLNGLTTHAGHDAAVDRSSIESKKTPASISTHSTPTPSRRGKPYSANTNPSPSSMPALSRICKPRGSAICMHSTMTFDAAEDVYRLDTATNPYDPN